MTRASLLHILDHVNGISEAEIRELEQLAAAFPYCQTAHVLLAKAAHDRGSMLASQRLRRAATYAADRELLRQLIERPAPAMAEAAPGFSSYAASLPAAYIPEPQQPVTEAAEVFADYTTHNVAEQPETLEAVPDTFQATPEAELAQAEDSGQPDSDAAVQVEGESVPATSEPELKLESEPATWEGPAVVAEATPEAIAAEAERPEATAEAFSSFEGAYSEPISEVEPDAPVAEHSVTSWVAAEPELEPESESESELAAAATDSSAPAANDLLPAVAPPIRPPVEVGAARFEFGLADTEPELVPIYQLPTLDDEEEPVLAPPAVSIPAFQADADLAYALSGGGRLGYGLQLRDELTQDLPADDFFAPDALLLAHVRVHTPPAPVPSRSSFELINKFLRAQPRLKAPTPTAPPAEEQADLSVRSTQVVPDLASESLAKIMVRQGKTAKAIEIYERLIVRQPEKKAYFAEQIQQLKNSE